MLVVVVVLASVMMGLFVYSFLTSLEMFVSALAMAVGSLAIVLYLWFVHSIAKDMRLEDERISTSSPRNCTTPN